MCKMACEMKERWVAGVGNVGNAGYGGGKVAKKENFGRFVCFLAQFGRVLRPDAFCRG